MWLWLACALPDAGPVPAAPDAEVPAWRQRPLTLTRHGRCRIGCRQFDRDEVEAILAKGRWVPERTRHDGPCPSHAVEGTTRDGQHARMVFAACPRETKLVTAIDLDTKWPCSCD